MASTGASALLLLRPTRSLRLFRQMIGRVLRNAPGKKQALIIDAGQAYLDCGLPDSPVDWSLDGVKESPRPTITDGGGEVTEHPQAELILAEQLKLEQITREQAERGRLQRGRENFATICSMARHGKVPRGAVYAAIGKQPRSRNEFAMAANVLGRSQEWAIAGWDKQNAGLLEKGLEAAPIKWPELEIEPVAGGATIEETWAAAVERCQQPGNRKLLSQYFKLTALEGGKATIQVDLNWAAWGRKHHEQIASVLCGAAGANLQVEMSINPE